MAPHVIVSYDDTQSDHDALTLGRLFPRRRCLTDARLRTARPLADPDREALASHAAYALLDRGAALLEDFSVERRVVMSPSTPIGLGALADELAADVIAFGSEYRTPAGRVAIGRSAETLLQNGPAALAFAPAGFADAPRALETIAILPGTADEAAIETAHSLAARHDARVTDAVRGVDLIVVGSRPEAREGRVMITSSAAAAIDQATAPVLILARGSALSFETLVTV